MNVTEETIDATLDSNGKLRLTQKWQELLEEILPRQGEWSEEEYLVLTDHRSRLIEFTDGFLEVLPVPTAKHQMLLTETITVLRLGADGYEDAGTFKCGESAISVLRPDFSVSCLAEVFDSAQMK